MKIRVLTKDDVQQAVSMSRVIEIVKRTFVRRTCQPDRQDRGSGNRGQERRSDRGHEWLRKTPQGMSFPGYHLSILSWRIV